ncbi:MAG TPA: NTP transferase domain-containing protein [Acidimicrobiales bacterium]|nr:NTP transferase domain-containing protein [Acidimicrobiales bacterium]
MSGPSLVILAAGRARRYGGLKQLAPVGVNGEGVIDLLASDAYAAGFDDIVIVVNPDTGPTIREHVAEHWPHAHRVAFEVQESLRGTVDAVLAATPSLDLSRPFGVSNADDLYGRDAFAQLGRHLMTSPNHCLVGYRLERAVTGELPVSRGTCNVVNGHLTDIFERRNVTATLDGYVADDGQTPHTLHPQTIVSMNLWGFQPSVVEAMRQAVAAHDFSVEPEVMLPVFVGSVLHRSPMRFDVLTTTSRCIGVTHAEDLPLAQAMVLQEVEAGERPASAFA